MVDEKKENTSEGVGKKKGRVRECLKDEPLQPLYTGRKRKSNKATRPKYNTKKGKTPRKISKAKPSHPESQKITISTSSGLKGNPSRGKQKSRKSVLPTIVVEEEVIFSARVECEACEEGRKGEGSSDCWACRLARLRNIQENKIKSQSTDN